VSRLRPIFQNRDYTRRIKPDNLAWTVDGLEWSVMGGCTAASLSAEGPELQLWDLIETLRCPVTIQDEEGRNAWWGFVNDVEVDIAGFRTTLSLDSMTNRVAVVYSYVASGTDVTGEQKTTAWATSAESIAEYGTREWLESCGGMTDAAATGRRDALLALQKYPGAPGASSVQTGSGGENRARASIRCSGWFSSLGWKYAAVAAGTATATTAQISALVTSFGQFIASTTISAASGIDINPYREGKTTALQEVLALMEIGGPSGRRYLAAVDELRQLYVWEEEAKGETYVMDRQRILKKLEKSLAATSVLEYQPPVGVWVRLVDVIPSSADTSRLADLTLQFIEGASWAPAGGLQLRYRGQPSVEEMMRYK
jgi:hypothetical protein